MSARREGRLRRKYALWYPGIQIPLWLPAKGIARAVTRQLPEGEPHHLHPPRWEVGPRILDDRHFEFRGGEEARPAGARSRREDRAAGLDISDPPERAIV